MLGEFLAHTPAKGSANWHGLQEHTEAVANLAAYAVGQTYGDLLALRYPSLSGGIQQRPVEEAPPLTPGKLAIFTTLWM